MTTMLGQDVSAVPSGTRAGRTRAQDALHQIAHWYQDVCQTDATGRRADCPPVTDPDGLPAGWRLIVTMPDPLFHVVEFPSGCVLLHASTVRCQFTPSVRMVYPSLGDMVAAKLLPDVGVVVQPSWKQTYVEAVLPFYDPYDPVEASERMLVALGADPTMMPAATYRVPLPRAVGP